MVESGQSPSEAVAGHRQCGGVEPATDGVQLSEVGQLAADALCHAHQLSLCVGGWVWCVRVSGMG